MSLRAPYSGFRAPLDPRVRHAVLDLADALASLGHDVVEDDPRYGLIGASFLPRSMAGLWDCAQGVPDAELLDPRTRANAAHGRLLRGPVLAAARRAEARQHRRIGRTFQHVDVVLAPTTATPPPLVGAFDGLSNSQTDATMIAACPYAWPWNVLGWPSVNVPAGFTSDGLPMGAQLMGPMNSEPRLVALAAQLQDAQRWQDHTPTAFLSSSK